MDQIAFQMTGALPHGICFAWDRTLLLLHVVSDALVAAAYFSIPFVLWTFVRRRRDLQFKATFVMFGLFILFCGLTHVLAIWVIWRPDYALEGIVKALTAAASIGTAVVLWPLLPKALALPSPADLQRANRELRAENERRRAAEVELKRANETLARRIEELQWFSYTISHDLRAPLRAIDGFSSLALEEHGAAMPSGARSLIERASGAARRMARLIDGLLEFVRLERTHVGRGVVDMRALAHEAIELVRPKYPHVRFSVSELPPAHADAALVRQVWANLIDNAGKFSAGAATPEVRIEAQDREDGVVYVVRDNGLGFDPRHADKMFQIFQRLHTREVPGEGIGLAVVRRIVERHGGWVAANGTPGAGAEFRFTLGRGETPGSGAGEPEMASTATC